MLRRILMFTWSLGPRVRSSSELCASSGSSHRVFSFVHLHSYSKRLVPADIFRAVHCQPLSVPHPNRRASATKKA